MSHQNGRSRLLQFTLIVLAGILLLINSASAQTGAASIVGTVSDPNGAVVPGAKISIKNVDTNQEFVLTFGFRGRLCCGRPAAGQLRVARRRHRLRHRSAQRNHSDCGASGADQCLR